MSRLIKLSNYDDGNNSNAELSDEAADSTNSIAHQYVLPIVSILFL